MSKEEFTTPSAWREGLVVFAVVFLTIPLAVTGFHRAWQQDAPPAPRLLNVSSSEVIGGQRQADTKPATLYTLVEFADYQCPPCRAMQPALANTLERHSGKLRMVFRNFPLTQIHPQALPAAIAAEAAREQGKFQQIHATLFKKQETLNSNLILQIAKDHRLDMKRFQKSQQTTALKAVRKDKQEAEALNLKSTPSFVLCCPDGKVVALGTLSQIEDYIH